jgi:acyl-CoA synthetase (AMP-forming)/AMP-acid ligase II
MSHALLEAWEKNLRRRGGARAMVEAAAGKTWTFAELNSAAEAWVATHGQSGRTLARHAVVFALPNSGAWLEVFLGLLKAGAVAVPLDPGEPVASQQHLAKELRAGFLWDGKTLVPLSGARRYRDPATCLVKLTSGSTGRPRALVFTSGQMLADGRQVMATMGIRPRDLNYASIPFGHSYGLGNLTIPLLAGGVPIVVGTSALPQAIAGDFARWQPTVFPGVPTMWRALAASDVRLDSLRLGISAGAPLAAEVARQFANKFGRRLHSFYGSSETGGISYDRTGRAALEGNVGTAMRGVKLKGLRGQRLCVSSAAVMTQGNPRRVGPDGAWIMPDRVMMGADGAIILHGRRSGTVKIAGRRVNLADVVGRLRRLPSVRDAWVGVRAGADPVLAAVVATERTPAELRAALLPSTAAWLIPKKLLTVTALPHTARGKTDTRALQAMIS